MAQEYIPKNQEEQELVKLAIMKMPFGRYEGWYISELPENYIVWFAQKGYPAGQLGEMLRAIYEIKLNGLEYLLRNIRMKINK
jgi:uncharacterized protein (DUF3820 family)